MELPGDILLPNHISVQRIGRNQGHRSGSFGDVVDQHARILLGMPSSSVVLASSSFD
jgi:hypothetical protein